MSTEKENTPPVGESQAPAPAAENGGAFPQMQMEEFMLLKQQHDELAAKVSDYENLIKRQQAEFENFRRRTLREREDQLRFAGGDVLKDLLSVVDNFDRAAEIQADEAGNTPKAFHDGMMLIRTQLQDLLQKNAVKPIDGTGSPFNPEIHMAIAQENAPMGKVDTVADVFQKGYWHHDRVLRLATVKVSKAAPESVDAPDPSPPAQP
ncbi:MAG: nucleotide exchange factor GrpE [Spirochaetes bacterium]|nr:nucleotide exchange factor GrpE [Spirochaetota bacterium]